MRERTADWFAHNAERLSLEGSVTTVLDSYARHTPGGTPA